MKSFKTLISEVAQPSERGADEEQAFKDQHTYEVIPHPVALDHQFTGDIPQPEAKLDQRRADQEGSANYDTAYAYGMNAMFDKAGLGESADDNHTVDIDHTGGSDANAKKHNITIKKNKGTDNSHDASGKKKDLQKYLAKHYDSAEDAKELHPEVHESVTEDAAQEIPMMSKQLDFIAMAAKAIKESLRGDPEEWYQNKLGTAHEAMKTLHANITEALVGGQKELDHDKDGDIDGDDFAKLRAKKKKKNESVEELEEYSNWKIQHPTKSTKSYTVKARNAGEAIKKGHAAAKKAGDMHAASDNRMFKPKHIQKEDLDETTMSAIKKPVTMTTVDGKTRTVMKTTKDNKTDDRGQDKITTNEGTESLDEAFKAGIVKLKDNSSMVLKKEDADVLNKLFKKMSSGSVKKMTETAMKDKSGFAEILSFAKEAL
jgi:hypothetical protein